MEDLGGRQDDDAEDDLEEGQRFGGQAASASVCAMEDELLGGRTQWHRR